MPKIVKTLISQYFSQTGMFSILYIRKSNPRFRDQGRKQIKRTWMKNLMAYIIEMWNSRRKRLTCFIQWWILMLLFVSDTDQAFNEAFSVGSVGWIQGLKRCLSSSSLPSPVCSAPLFIPHKIALLMAKVFSFSSSQNEVSLPWSQSHSSCELITKAEVKNAQWANPGSCNHF